MARYIALIRKGANTDFGVDFPDLPGCISAGATLDEALAMAREALELHLEGMAAEGYEIPAPSSLEEIMADAENRDGVAALIDAASPKAQGVPRRSPTLEPPRSGRKAASS
jgi:predicted RNase H-like HicB family nuclease